MRLVVLAGGFGGSKMAHGFAMAAETRGGHAGADVELTVIGNTGDDLELHGLHVSPDLDTLMYTLAGLANQQTGWGVRDETWSAAEMLARYGEPTWFRLGDRDLATHIVRSARLRAGETLTGVTDFLRRRLAVRASLLPMTDQPVRTRVRTAAGWLPFQDWFVRNHHADEVLELAYEGVDEAAPTSQVLAALANAELVVLAPSNPFVSIGPILAVPGLGDALLASPAPVVAISPIVGGVALRGPAEAMLRSLAGDSGAAGVARWYGANHRGLIDYFVIDESDADESDAVRAAGLAPVVLPTVMRSDEDRRALAAAILAWAALPA